MMIKWSPEEMKQILGLGKIMIYRDLPWYYAELLDWKVENGFVKAFPKRELSDKAFHIIRQAFKGWGGKFVSRRGKYWFECPLNGCSSTSTKVAEDTKRAYEELQKEV